MVFVDDAAVGVFKVFALLLVSQSVDGEDDTSYYVSFTIHCLECGEGAEGFVFLLAFILFVYTNYFESKVVELDVFSQEGSIGFAQFLCHFPTDDDDFSLFFHVESVDKPSVQQFVFLYFEVFGSHASHCG